MIRLLAFLAPSLLLLVLGLAALRFGINTLPDKRGGHGLEAILAYTFGTLGVILSPVVGTIGLVRLTRSKRLTAYLAPGFALLFASLVAVVVGAVALQGITGTVPWGPATALREGVLGLALSPIVLFCGAMAFARRRRRDGSSS